jgi:hypothetical protein
MPLSHPREKKSGLKPTHQNPPMIFASPNTQPDRLQEENYRISTRGDHGGKREKGELTVKSGKKHLTAGLISIMSNRK